MAAFWEAAPSIRARLGEFSVRNWQDAMFWLTVSGLALYFLDRLTFLGLEECMPSSILARLRQNLADNRERTVSLFDEAIALNQELGKLNISFSFLKGITLTPESVPDATFRCQTDLDLPSANRIQRLCLRCWESADIDSSPQADRLMNSRPARMERELCTTSTRREEIVRWIFTCWAKCRMARRSLRID